MRSKLDRMAIGLCLSRPALAELWPAPSRPSPGRLARRADELEVLPQRFRRELPAPVSSAPSTTDWSTADRTAIYLSTLRDPTEVLAPGIDEGTISTLPVAHRDELVDPGAEQAALGRLCRLAVDLARLADRTGRRVRVCCEPEPGCLLETTADAIEWWTSSLPAAARRTGTPPDVIAAHLGLCFDTCHQAVALRSRASLYSLSSAVSRSQDGTVQLACGPVAGRPRTQRVERFASRASFIRCLRAGLMAPCLGRDSRPDLRLPSHGRGACPFTSDHRAAVGDVETTRDFPARRIAMGCARRGGACPPRGREPTPGRLPESDRPADTASLCAAWRPAAWASGS